MKLNNKQKLPDSKVIFQFHISMNVSDQFESHFGKRIIKFLHLLSTAVKHNARNTREQLVASRGPKARCDCACYVPLLVMYATAGKFILAIIARHFNW